MDLEGNPGPRLFFLSLTALSEHWGVPVEDLEVEAKRRGLKGFSIIPAPKVR